MNREILKPSQWIAIDHIKMCNLIKDYCKRQLSEESIDFILHHLEIDSNVSPQVHVQHIVFLFKDTFKEHFTNEEIKPDPQVIVDERLILPQEIRDPTIQL